MDKKGLLSSLAVFASLTKSSDNIVDVLLLFIYQAIKTRKLYKFSATEMTRVLKEIYVFDIPTAVITTAIGKIEFVTKNQGIFTVDDIPRLDVYDIEDEENKHKQDSDDILNELVGYIKERDEDVSKKAVVREFTDFMLDKGSKSKYSNYISAFVVEHSKDKEFNEKIKIIKEGTILYNGLKYKHANGKSWKNRIHIYLHTDMLCHLGGYDGAVRKLLAEDCLELVKEANGVKKNIFFYYMDEVEEEMDYFFETARKIINKEIPLNKPDNAIATISKMCKTPMEVTIEKTKFYRMLETFGILKNPNSLNVYGAENYKYNIESKLLLDKHLQDEDPEQIKSYMDTLNYISIERGERAENGFEDVGSILLTNNYKIRNISWDEEAKLRIPLATSLQFLTNHLWYKLNKSFICDKVPLTFDVMTKARVILSSNVSDKINKEYDELEKKLDNEEFDEQDGKAMLYELRERSKLPEEIHADVIDDVLETLTNGIEEYSFLHTKLKKEHIKSLAEGKVLENDLEKEKASGTIQREKIEEMECNLLKEKKERLKLLKEKKQKIISAAKKRISKFNKIVAFSAVIYLLIIPFIIYKFGWNNIEQFTFIFLFFLPTAFTFMYSFYTGNKFKVNKIRSTKEKNYLKEEMKKADFNEESIVLLKDEIKKMEEEQTEE